MGHSAEAPQIEVPPILFFGQAHVADALQKSVVAMLTLRATDDLPHARYQDVHRTHGFAVVVLIHVEGFDVRGVIGDDHGALHVLFSEIALVLALQVDAPLHWELELLAASFENRNRFGVGDPLEGTRRNGFETFDDARLNALVEEFEVVGTGSHHVAKDGLQE